MLEQIKKKNKKGMSTLEFVLCFLIFIIIFSFISDCFLVAYKQYSVSKTTKDLARMLAVQGGIATSCPENYPGDLQNYYTYQEIEDIIQDLNDNIFVEDDKMSVVLSYYYIADPSNPNDITNISTYLYPNSNASLPDIYLPYGSFITVTINYPMKWGVWNAVCRGVGLPFDDNKILSVPKSDVTEYMSWNNQYTTN